MSTNDRRSGTERRGTNRYPVEMDVEWVGSAGRSPGTISDLSLDGCFVLSSGDVNDGENIKLYVPLTDGMKVEFSDRVANHVFEIGFGKSLTRYRLLNGICWSRSSGTTNSLKYLRFCVPMPPRQLRGRQSGTYSRQLTDSFRAPFPRL